MWHLLLSSLRFSWRLRLSFTCCFFFTLHCIFSFSCFLVFVSHSSYAPNTCLMSSFHSTASSYTCCVFSPCLRCFYTYLPCFTHESPFLLLSLSCCRAWCLHILCAVILCLCCTFSLRAGALHTRAALSLLSRVSLLYTRLLVYYVYTYWLFVAVLWCLLLLTVSLIFCVPSLAYIFSLLGFWCTQVWHFLWHASCCASLLCMYTGHACLIYIFDMHSSCAFVLLRIKYFCYITILFPSYFLTCISIH